MNTPEGGQNFRKTMIAKYGSEAAWREFMRQIGREGGKNGRGHDFAHGKFDQHEAGRIGGRISRRGKKVPDGLV